MNAHFLKTNIFRVSRLMYPIEFLKNLLSYTKDRKFYKKFWEAKQRILVDKKATRLNIGCGTDYREGFINIDGSPKLQRVDRVIDISVQRLSDFYEEKSIDYILSNDIIEHLFHWEAQELLQQFFTLLKHGGIIEIRVPDCSHIIYSGRYTLEEKLTLLFGGQDVPQNMDHEMDSSRKEYPQYFCHKYGWNIERMKKELKKIGFSDIACARSGSNFIALAKKELAI